MTRIPKDPAAEIPLSGLEVFKDDFMTSRREDLQKIRNALVQMDYSVLGKFSHSWRGFAVPYGFGELVHFAEELEVAAAAQDQNSCKKILVEIEAYLSSK